MTMNKHERELYFATLEESLLKGGAAFSEWCILIAKSIYISFINEADLATIITSVACIETYFKSESPQDKNKSLLQLINETLSLKKKNINYTFCENIETVGFMPTESMIWTFFLMKKNIKRN